MKRMLRLLFAALVVCGGSALRASATPVAQWDGFETLTSGAMTVDLGSYTWDAVTGYIEITDAPILITGTTNWNPRDAGKAITVAAKVSNLTNDSTLTAAQTLASLTLGTSDNMLGLMTASGGGKLGGLWSNATTPRTGSNSINTAFPSDKGTYTLFLTYSDAGTFCWAWNDNQKVLIKYVNDTGLKGSGNVGGKIALGAKVGGALPAAGLRIHSVKVYDVTLTDAEMVNIASSVNYQKYAPVITWAGTSGTFHNGPFVKMTDGSSPAWQVFASNQSAYVAPGSTLRFAPGSGVSGDLDAQFAPFTLGGLIVESGATGMSLVSTTGTRSTELGDVVNKTTETYFTFHEDLTINRNGSTTFYGPCRLEIDAGKTFTITNAAALDASAQLSMTGGGQFAFGGTLALAGRALDVSGFSLTSDDGAVAPLKGTVTLDASTVLRLSAGASENTAYKLVEGVLNTAETLTIQTSNLYVGDEQKNATLTLTTDGTLAFVLDARQPKTLVWTSGDATWEAATVWTVEGGVSETDVFANGDTVVFNGDAVVTVAASVIPAAIRIDAGTVTLKNRNHLGAVSTTVAAGATLRCDDVTATTLQLSGSGTLALDVGSGDFTSALLPSSVFVGFTGTLQIASGRYSAGSSPIASGVAIIVEDGGQMYLGGGTWANAFTLAGAGWNASGDTAKVGALRGDGATISGPVTLAGNASAGGYNGDMTFSGALSTGSFTLTKAHGRALILSNTASSGTIDVLAGTVNLNTSGDYTQKLVFSLATGTTLSLSNAGGKISHSASHVTLAGGAKLTIQNGNSAGGTFVAGLTVDASATEASPAQIDASLYGGSTNLSGPIDGAGVLKLISSGNANGYTISGAISGTVRLVVADASVTLSGANTSTGGFVAAENVSTGSVGAGDVSVAAGKTLTMSGSNVAVIAAEAELSGVGTIAGATTFNAGATLAVTKGASLTVTGALTLPTAGKVAVTLPADAAAGDALLTCTAPTAEGAKAFSAQGFAVAADANGYVLAALPAPAKPEGDTGSYDAAAATALGQAAADAGITEPFKVMVPGRDGATEASTAQVNGVLECFSGVELVADATAKTVTLAYAFGIERLTIKTLTVDAVAGNYVVLAAKVQSASAAGADYAAGTAVEVWLNGAKCETAVPMTADPEGNASAAGVKWFRVPHDPAATGTFNFTVKAVSTTAP